MQDCSSHDRPIGFVGDERATLGAERSVTCVRWPRSSSTYCPDLTVGARPISRTKPGGAGDRSVPLASAVQPSKLRSRGNAHIAYVLRGSWITHAGERAGFMPNTRGQASLATWLGACTPVESCPGGSPSSIRVRGGCRRVATAPGREGILGAHAFHVR